LFQETPLSSNNNKTAYFLDGDSSPDELVRFIESNSTLKTLFNMCKGEESKLVEIFREQQALFLRTCGHTPTQLSYLPSNVDVYEEKKQQIKVFESLMITEVFEFYVNKCLGWVQEDKKNSEMYEVENFLPENIERFISSLFVDQSLYQIIPDGEDKPDLKSTQARTLRVGLLFRKTSQILSLLQKTPFVKDYLKSDIKDRTNLDLSQKAESYAYRTGGNSPTRKFLDRVDADTAKNVLETSYHHPITEWFSKDGKYEVSNIKDPANRDPEFINLIEFVYAKIFELGAGIESETAYQNTPATKLRKTFSLEPVHTINGKNKLEQLKDKKEYLVELLLQLTRSKLLYLPKNGIFESNFSYDTWDNPYTELKDTVRIYTRTLDSLGYDSAKLIQHIEEKKVERDANQPQLIPESKYLSPLSSGGKKVAPKV